MVAQQIRQTAVIGAGTMGSQIAAVIANADTKVLLLDIVPKGANDRDILAKNALMKLQDSGNIFLSEQKASNITPGNMEDDLDKLKQVDWVIECVPEDKIIKHETYKKVGGHTGENTLVSSNTSTIPLHELKKGLDINLQRRLCITHFFNPPPRMPLLEVVTDKDNDSQVIKSFTMFADHVLGKNVVMVKDTPGFIANRIGIFWMLCAMEEAIKENIPVETADAIMNGAFGFPKTGVFGLADLIGLKLIPDMAESMLKLLPPADDLCGLKKGLELVKETIKQGNKGFYKKEGNVKQVLDLKSMGYHKILNPDIRINHWHEFFSKNLPENQFARKTLIRLLVYTAQIAPDIANSIVDIDSAMRDGYGWKYGPFEIIDMLGVTYLMEDMQRQELSMPELLKQAEGRGFYPQSANKGKQYLGFSGQYQEQKPQDNKWTLALKTIGSQPVIENKTARLWDIGDGIACFEITSNMSVIDERTLNLLLQAIDKTEDDFAGLIIGHDGRHFSAGMDLNIIIDSSKKNNWKRVEDIIRQGQDTMLRIKTARVPIVPALCGYVLGGACELTMHCAEVQAHILTRIGLVEADIGVLPGWGGIKEHLIKALERGGEDTDTVIEEVLLAFHQIAGAKKSSNAEDAISMKLLDDISHITRNRERLLPDTKQRCLQLTEGYQIRENITIEAPVAALYERLIQEVEMICESESDMEPHRKKTLQILAEVLSGYKALKNMEKGGIEQPRAGWNRLSERHILDSDRNAFMELVQTKEALEKIGKVLHQ